MYPSIYLSIYLPINAPEFPVSEPEIKISLQEDITKTDKESLVITYTKETGRGIFDYYLFSINDSTSTQIYKTRESERMVRFENLLAGRLYRVKACSVSGEQKQRSREITLDVRTGKLVQRFAYIQ